MALEAFDRSRSRLGPINAFHQDWGNGILFWQEDIYIAAHAFIFTKTNINGIVIILENIIGCELHENNFLSWSLCFWLNAVIAIKFGLVATYILTIISGS